MSTYRLKFMSRRDHGFFVLSLVVGVLVAQWLMWPAVAFAATANSSDGGYQFGKAQGLDRASVSVVRLVAGYSSVPAIAGCAQSVTGLGVLVGSWATTPGSKDFNSWVLTDGSLIDPGGISCGVRKPMEQLSSIQIYANNAYTSSTNGLVLKSLQCHAAACSDGAPPQALSCQNAIACDTGVVLVPFHMPVPQPFIDLTQTDQTVTEPQGIELTGPAPISIDQVTQALMPIQVATNDPKNEPGMPIINANGQLVDMNTKAADTGQTIRSFVSAVIAPAPLQPVNTNALRDSWNRGIDDYYNNDFVSAQSNFIRASVPNTQFLAPAAFLNLPQIRAVITPTSSARSGGTTGAGGTSNTVRSQTGPFAIPGEVLAWFPWIIGGAILLIVILVVIIVLVVRVRHGREMEAFEKEQAAAEEKAATEIQRQQSQPQVAVNVNGPANAASLHPQPKSELRCPNCGEPVNASDNFCAQCRSPLRLSDSGLNMRVAKPQEAAQVPAGTMPQPRELVPSSSIFDQPTREMSPGEVKNGQQDLEKTRPYSAEEMVANMPTIERYMGPNLSLVVGTRSNPGIKRQHKPNEDSLFAAQGERVHNSQTQQFGLFVVADGMGGHANGQDASRQAIQTISEEVLPKISGNDPLNDEMLVQILVDGVQHANQAVHQRNMEQRADMGTTITVALIMGAIAYIANVGDSRTYLYRKAAGLKKITNDHSVVASLVEAGIIRPDDIYTHPKRNQIYRSLGEKPMVDVDWFKVMLQPEDKLLLCTDGLWDMVRDPTIEQILSAVPDPSQTGNALIKAALEGGGEDNVSVIVVQIAEASQRTGMTGVQLLARPESPQWPPM
ncbi:MAG TPA: protein phosphatase 2C domain-containing protein [Ktedonobacteraceae bacterium]